MVETKPGIFFLVSIMQIHTENLQTVAAHLSHRSFTPFFPSVSPFLNVIHFLPFENSGNSTMLHLTLEYGNNYNFRIFRQLWNEYNYGPIITGYTSSKTGYWTQTSNANQLSHSEWHHVVFTKDATQSAYYLDGVRIHSTPYPASQSEPAVAPAKDIIIGDSAVDTDIDNLRIYNRGLNLDEILANGGFPPQATTTTTSTTTTTTTPTTTITTTTTQPILNTGSSAVATPTTVSAGGSTPSTSQPILNSGTYAATTPITVYAPPTATTATPTYTPSGTATTNPGVYYPTGTQIPPSQIPPSQVAPQTSTTESMPTTAYLETENSFEQEDDVFYTTAPQEPSTALSRSLQGAEATVRNFEEFMYGLDTSKVSQRALNNGFDLLEPDFRSQVIFRLINR
jgi:hypothetical protein